MYAREQKAQLVKYGKRLNPETKPVKGINRRTLALLPDRKLAQADLLLARKSSIYQQLLSIEANKLSCCLKITSPRSKSRSAMLIYQGQVLGCVYGSKKSPNQLFGVRAYEKIMAEITRFDNFVDGFILSPQVLLAAGSMFHEHVIQADDSDESAVFVARRALNQFEWDEAAGSLVVTNEKNEPLSVMYFSQRSLLGSQLLTHEKAPQNLNKLWPYLELHPNAKVYASMLSSQMTDAPSLTFGLSGLNQESAARESGEESFSDVAKLTILHVIRTPKVIEPVSLNRFVNINKAFTRPGQQPRLYQRFRGVGFYDVDPRH